MWASEEFRVSSLNSWLKQPTFMKFKQRLIIHLRIGKTVWAQINISPTPLDCVLRPTLFPKPIQSISEFWKLLNKQINLLTEIRNTFNVTSHMNPKTNRDEEEYVPQNQVSDDVREIVERLPGYHDYQREQHNEILTLADY